jgi:hypothetical protein
MGGRTYLERGQSVVLARWAGKGSRNVLVRRPPSAVRRASWWCGRVAGLAHARAEPAALAR